MRRTLVALFVMVGACARPTANPFPHRDAPLELRDEHDRAQERDFLFSLSDDDGERRARTAALVAALAQELRRANGQQDLNAVRRAVDELASLWIGRVGEMADFLPVTVDELWNAKALLARAGATDDVMRALVLIVEADTTRRRQALAELEEVSTYLDELSMAEHGDGGRGARLAPIAVVVARQLPTEWFVDRVVAILVQRQAAVAQILAQGNPQLHVGTLRAHRDVLGTAYEIAALYGLADRVPELSGALLRIRGIGADRNLLQRASDAERASTAKPWLELAELLARGLDQDTDSPTARDHHAALSVAWQATRRFPADVSALTAAAEHAEGAGRRLLARRLYARLYQLQPDDPIAFRGAIRTTIHSIDDAAAAGRLVRARQLHAEAVGWVENAKSKTGFHSHASFAHTSLDVAMGTAFLRYGLVDEGMDLLARANNRHRTAAGFEAVAVATTALEQPQRALASSIAALSATGLDADAAASRARRHRLVAEAALAVGDDAVAQQHLHAALSAWADDKNRSDASVDNAAERLVEVGRVLWAQGERERALDFLQMGMSTGDPTGLAVESAVDFLLSVEQTDDALVAVKRTLPAPELAPQRKVYMALRVLALMQRAGRTRDSELDGYLRQQRGHHWWQQLAQAAVGVRPWSEVARLAQTRREHVEVAFYRAMFAGGNDVLAELRRVVASHLIYSFEFHAARRQLARTANGAT